MNKAHGKVNKLMRSLFESPQGNGNMKYIVKINITEKRSKDIDRFRMVELATVKNNIRLIHSFNGQEFVSFEVLTALPLKIQFFWGANFALLNSVLQSFRASVLRM